MQRNGEEHPDYDTWETELDQLLAYRQENESIGGKNAEVTTAAKAGRAIGGAIKRSFVALQNLGSSKGGEVG